MICRVLGPLEVVVDGRAVDAGGLKQRTVLALLLAAHGRPVSVDRLVDEVWGEEPPAKVMTSLQSYIANLRRVLEPGRGPRTPAGVLLTRSPGYALALPAGALDADAFAEAAARGRSLVADDPEAAMRELDRALALWRGDAYADTAVHAPSLTSEAARLTEVRLLAVEARGEAMVALGAPEAVGELAGLVREHPLREHAWALLALALYRGGRQAEALDAVARARRLLADELGLDPGAALRELEQAILRHDVPPPAPRPQVVTATERPPVPEPDAGAVEHPLVGRQAELASLAGALERAQQGRGQLVLLDGEAGVGKSRLTRALGELARRQGMTVGVGRWEEGEAAPPLWAWREALGEDASTGPDRDRRLLGDHEATTHALTEAVVASLRASPRARLVVLEDAHWADRDSLRLLTRVASRLAELPAAVVVTFRDTGPAANEALAAALGVLATGTDVRVHLTGLDAAGIASFCDARGIRVSPAAAAALHDRAGGNPFYVSELVRLLARREELTDPAAVTALEVPHGVRDVVRRRAADLPADAAALLTVAAVAGRVVDVDVIEAASGLGEEAAAAAVEALLLAGLLEEETPSRYRFPHALTREAVYGQVPGPRRAKLHGAVAAALLSSRPGGPADHTEELALHYALAGPRHAAAARTYALAASARASRSGAFHEAVRWAETAERAVAVDQAATRSAAEDVAAALTRARVAAGQVREAVAGAGRAAAIALSSGDAMAAARLLITVTGAPWVWREYGASDPATITLLRSVLDALPEDDVRHRALLTAFLAAELFYADEPESLALARRALELVPQSAGVDAEPHVIELLVSVHTAMQRCHLLDERLAVVDRLEAAAREQRDDALLALALTFRASASYESGDWTGARRLHGQARRLATDHHLVQVLVALGYADVLVALAEGRFIAAAERLDEVQRLHATTSIVAVDYLRLAQTANLLLAQGRLAEFEPVLRQRRDDPPMRDLYALALLHAGDRDGARRVLGPWSAQPPISRDFLWLALTVVRALVWTDLGDLEAIAHLRAELEPFRQRVAWAGSGVFMMGPVSAALALLADAAGTSEEASKDAAEARRAVEQYGWRGLPPKLVAVVDGYARGPGAPGKAECADGRSAAQGVRG